MSEPLAIQLESWKEKAINGTITIDELTEAIKVLRANRLSAGIAQSRARATKATDTIFDGANDCVVDTDSMTFLSDTTRIGNNRMFDFGTTSKVHHTNYYEHPIS